MKKILYLEKGEPLLKGILKGDIYQLVIQDVRKEMSSKEKGDSQVHQNLNDLQSQESSLQEILLVWKRIHNQLYSKISDFYSYPLYHDPTTLDDEESIQGLCSQMASTFHASCPQFSWQRVLVMTALFLLERFSEEKREEILSPTTEWDEILQQISSWAPFHSAWRSVDTFIQQLLHVQSVKDSFRQKQVEELKRALKELNESKDMLNFLSLDGFASFRLELASKERLGEVNTLLFRLKNAIHRYRKLLIALPETIHHRRKLDGQLFFLEEEIHSTYKNLSACFLDREQALALPRSILSLSEEFAIEEGEEFIFSLIEEGDLAGAYWLASSLGGPGEYDRLMKALQGARWFIRSDGLFYGDLKQVFNELVHLTGPVQRMMVFAAAILPVYFAPEIVDPSLLGDPLGLPGMEDLSRYFTQSLESGIVLRLDQLPGHQMREEREVRIKNRALQAQGYLARRRERKISFQSSLILQRLLKPNTEIYQMLTIVAEDERCKSKDLSSLLQSFEGEERIREQLQVYYSHEIGEDLLEHTQRIVSAVRSWSYLVSQDAKVLEDESYYKRLEDISRSLILQLPSLIGDIDDVLADQSMRIDVRCGALMMKESFLEILSLLDFQKKREGISWCFQGAASLQDALKQRLLWAPRLHLQDSGEPSSMHGKELYRFLRSPLSPESLLSTISYQRERGDYRFLDRIVAFLPQGEEPLREEIERERKEREEGLLLKIRAIQDLLERSYQGGVVDTEKRMEIKKALLLPEEIRSFPLLEERLDTIEGDLSRSYGEELKRKTNRFEEILRQSKEEAIPFLDEMRKGFQEQDLVRMGRYIKAIEDYVASKAMEGLPRNQLLLYFLKQVHGIERYAISDSRFRLLLRSLQRGLAWGNMSFEHLTPSHRSKAERVLKSYLLLKNKRFSKGESYEALKTIFSFLGFVFDEERGDTFKILQNQVNWIQLQVTMRAIGSSSFPQFGSHDGPLHLLCVQEKPGSDVLGSLLSSDSISEGHLFLILYFGRLTGYQRHQLLKASREQNVVAVVLDEILFLHLLGQEENRLNTFLHCSLPFSAINPYGAEAISQNLFFGRDDDLSSLTQKRGMTYLCGPWKIGKSALLYHTQKRFHQAKVYHYGLYVDGRSLEKEEDPQKLWKILKKKMESWGFEMGRGADGREVTSAIRKILKENSQVKLLILLDETGGFLQSSQAKEGKILYYLDQLALDSEDKLHIILSGPPYLFKYLQQQAPSIKPYFLGPLKIRSAYDLLEGPMESLGFTFEDKARQSALTETDGHPYLIQLFCHLLLKRLYQKHDRFGNLRSGPIVITIDDVKAIYPEILKEKRRSLGDVMASCPKYEAALLGILSHAAYYKGGGGFYTSWQLLDLARSLWPEQFGAWKEKEMENLLKELSILGALAPLEGGYLFLGEDIAPLFVDKGLEERIKGVFQKKEKE